VSDIKRGKFSQFSLDMLVRLASRAGLKPRLKLAAWADSPIGWCSSR